MKMSIIDQRPMWSMMRYSRVRSRSRRREPVCVHDQQDGQPDTFSHRHDDAGEEHQRRERPHAGLQQFAHAAQDGAGLAGAKLVKVSTG